MKKNTDSTTKPSTETQSLEGALAASVATKPALPLAPLETGSAQERDDRRKVLKELRERLKANRQALKALNDRYRALRQSQLGPLLDDIRRAKVAIAEADLALRQMELR